MRAFALTLLTFATPAAAHPHIYIDASLEFLVGPGGALTAVRPVWVYDELYSLQLIADLGLDADGDGILSDEDAARLLEAESTWDPRYEGDLYGLSGGATLALGPPESFEVSLRDGKITSAHTRPLVTPVDLTADEARWKNYDPYYYAAFTLTGGVRVTGRDNCQTEIIPADTEAALAKVDTLLFGPGSRELVDTEYPPVGEEFADEAIVTCAQD